MVNNVSAAILHLSDLHLGEDFYDSGSEDKSDGGNLKSVKAIIKNDGRIVMQSHDGFIVAGLHADISRAASHIGAPEKLFDFCVVTGDISTNATSDGRFTFARNYLIDQIPVPHKHATGHFEIGLKLGKEKVFCVPGNHDKVGSVTPKSYLKGFKDLPQKPNYVAESVARSGQRFIIYGIDSNLYSEGNTAVGEVSPLTLGWLKGEFEKRELSGPQDSPPVRILLLHHHPADLNRFRSWSIKSFFSFIGTDRFTKLMDGDRLLESCRGHIDIIMHGHEHFPIVFFNAESNCLIVSAGTTSKKQLDPKHKNSFHALAFTGRQFRIMRFDWNKGTFRPCYEWTGNLDAAGRGLEGSPINPIV